MLQDKRAVDPGHEKNGEKYNWQLSYYSRRGLMRRVGLRCLRPESPASIMQGTKSGEPRPGFE